MPIPTAGVRVRSAAALACAALALAGCTSSGTPERTIASGDVTEVPATAMDVGRSVDVALPSGVLSLGLAPDVGPISTGDGELEPGAGVDLVGLTWSWAAQPGSDARDVMLGTGASLPRPTLALVDGQDAVEIPIDAEPGRSGGAVVGAEDPTGLTVTFDGQTQTVDLTTGAVGAGQAAGLADLDDAARTLRRACRARDFPRQAALDHGCRVETTYLLPWISGLGWAPDGQTWLVVDVRISGSAQVRVGDAAGTPLEGAPSGVQRVAFPVAAGAPHAVGFDFGPGVGVVTVPLDD